MATISVYVCEGLCRKTVFTVLVCFNDDCTKHIYIYNDQGGFYRFLDKWLLHLMEEHGGP